SGRARVAERGRRTVRRHCPNLRVSSVLVLDNRRHDKGDASPVRRDARVAESGEAVVVRRLEGMGGRLGGQADRLTGAQKADRDWRQPAGVHDVQAVAGRRKLRAGSQRRDGRSARPTARPPVRLTAPVTEAYAAPPAGSAPGPPGPISGWNRMMQPFASTFEPAGVFGHLSRSSGTPSPSESRITWRGSGQPVVSTGVPAGVLGHLSRPSGTPSRSESI